MSEQQNHETESATANGTSKQADSEPRAASIESPPSRLSWDKPKHQLGRLGRAARVAIEFCGKHPVATGLFALLSLFGLGLSVYSFVADVETAKLSAEQAKLSNEQAKRVEQKLEAIDSKIGKAHRGGVFLFEEPIEIYWNNWWAHPLRSETDVAKYGQAEMTIRGEGKTVDFVGVLSMNCSNGKYFWRGTENFQQRLDEEEAIDLVPSQVIKNAYKLFCDS